MNIDSWDVFLLSAIASVIYLSAMFTRACVNNGFPELCL